MHVTINVTECSHKKPEIFFRVEFGALKSIPVPAPQYQTTICKRNIMLQLTLKSDEKITLAPAAVDHLGRPTKFESPVWTTNNSDLVTLTPSPDGTSCDISPTGIAGVVIVQLDLDGDAGAGVAPMMAQAEITITPALVSSLELTAGPIIPQ